MADYFPLISRAVAALDPNTRERREAIYARAREALNRQLLSLEPPIAAADLQRERNVLDDTIRKVEDEYAPPAPVHEPAQPPRLPPLPSLRPAAGIQPDDEDSRPREPVVAEPKRPAESRSPGGVSEPMQPSRRPKVDRKHSRAFATGSRSRLILVIGVPVLAAVGVLAYLWRDDPARYEQPGKDAATADAQQQAQQRKSAGRLDGSATPPATSAAKPAASPSVPQGQNQQPVLPVAARALFFEEKADDPRGSQSDGQVVWQLERLAGTGGKRYPVVRGTVSVAKAGMSIDLAFRKNADPSLPASHTVDVVFRPDAGRDGVRTIGPIEARDQETMPGVPLKGAMVPVGDNLFLIGLDKTELAIAGNIEAMAEKKWFAFQFQLADSKLGAVLIEKGPTGERVFREAIAAWAQ